MYKKITSATLAVALVLTCILSLVSIYRLKGNSHIINFTGIVRGASQRLVIHELNQIQDDELIEKIDNIIEELLTGEGEYDLNRLESDEYQNLMRQVQQSWNQLLDVIYRARKGGNRDELFLAGEQFFVLANQAVSEAEYYTERRVQTAEMLLLALTAVEFLFAGLFTFYNTKQEREHQELKKAEAANRKRSEDLFRMSHSLKAPLDDISELMYVADIDTYELLFLNEAGRKNFHIDSLEGRKCYRVLQGRETPCDFCTTKILKEGEIYTWEHTNSLTQRHYLLKDRLIEWEGHKARLELAFDTTEVEREKMQLRFTLETEKMITECVRTLYQEREVEKAVSQVLERLGKFFSADRSYVFGIKGQFMFNQFEWCAKGVEPQLEILQNIPLSAIDRWRPSFDRQECIIIENLDDIKFSSPEEYEILHKQSITSMVVAPLEQNGMLAGYLGVDNPPSDKLQNSASLLQTLGYFLMLAFQQAENRHQLSRLSYFDVLTSFYNRNRYIEDTNMLMKADTSVGIVFLDVNGLKDINDQYGHAFGDEILKKCADRMRRIFEGSDFYRIGGDEFVIIRRGGAREFERLADRLKQEFQSDPLCRAAIGSSWAEESTCLSQIIADADAKMYEDKKAFYRKNPVSKRYRHHSDELLPLTDPAILQKEIEKERFVVYFQPKISSADRLAVGAEALIRYRTKSNALILPGNFLPILEEGESISQIDFFVFEYVCSRLKRWKEEGKEEFPISVNFSSNSLALPSFVQRLTEICDSYGISPKYLEIEITESVKRIEGIDMRTLISGIREAGFAVSIDNFGTQCVDLSFLSAVEFDVLKLDKSLVDDVAHNPRTKDVVESIAEICHKLNIRMVAEGIETEEQLTALRSCGVELAQGFLFSEPISIDEYEARFLGKEAGNENHFM